MIRGLYTSGWSMMANNKKMDVISNNLANVNTNAFKKDTVIFESFPDVMTKCVQDGSDRNNSSTNIGTMELGNDIGEVFTYYNQGPLTETDNKLDFALQGSHSAFFTVQATDNQGNTTQYYTRDGSFSLNKNGQLMTSTGYEVLGEAGQIFLNGDDFIVEGDGSIVQNGVVVDRLRISQFADTTTLRKLGSNLVIRTNETQDVDFSGQVVQGFQEQSNVNIVKEMVDMITVMRAYEANQRTLQAIDGTLERAVNEIGAVR